MLFEQSFSEIMRSTLQKIDMLNRHRVEISNLEQLCSVLKLQGNKFMVAVDVDEIEINYHLHPSRYGDYLAIVESLAGMNALRTRCGNKNVCEIINLEPEAPAFWLHIPMVDPDTGLSLVQAAGVSAVNTEGEYA